MPKIKWEIIEEMNDDDGSPTCWGATINNPIYGKFCWISYLGEGYGYAVEIKNSDNIHVNEIMRCKSLASAKRWVAMHLK